MFIFFFMIFTLLPPITLGEGWTWTCDTASTFCRKSLFLLFKEVLNGTPMGVSIRTYWHPQGVSIRTYWHPLEIIMELLML